MEKYRIGEVEEIPEETPIWDGHKSNNKIEIMTWSNDDEETSIQIIPNNSGAAIADLKGDQLRAIICPSCGQTIKVQDQSTGGIQDLPGLPAGVKFDPSDQEILQHLEAKVLSDARKLHPLIDEFITTIDGENGICYTHPEKLPGVNKDGQVRHFFHRPSKAYTTGTRKRRKVHTDADGGETRWHKTGKTRPVSTPAGGGGSGSVKGYKKILVLYTNYGRQRKPEKTNWVMHQYHLGENEEEKEGELVVSKVFYQTQPRQCGMKDQTAVVHDHHHVVNMNNNNNNDDNNPGKSRLSGGFVEYCNAPYNISPYIHQQNVNRNQGSPQQLIQNAVVRGDESSFNIHLPSSASKGK